jgi:hypothetical protein
MGDHEPILMLTGDADGYGTRWILGGQEVGPAIARYLMDEGFIADTGSTEFGARTLTLTASGTEFRTEGTRWWAGLSILQRLRALITG